MSRWLSITDFHNEFALIRLDTSKSFGMFVPELIVSSSYK